MRPRPAPEPRRFMPAAPNPARTRSRPTCPRIRLSCQASWRACSRHTAPPLRSAAIALQVPPRRRAQHTGLKRCASPRLGGLGDATTKATVNWWPEWVRPAVAGTPDSHAVTIARGSRLRDGPAAELPLASRRNDPSSESDRFTAPPRQPPTAAQVTSGLSPVLEQGPCEPVMLEAAHTPGILQSTRFEQFLGVYRKCWSPAWHRLKWHALFVRSCWDQSL